MFTAANADKQPNRHNHIHSHTTDRIHATEESLNIHIQLLVVYNTSSEIIRGCSLDESTIDGRTIDHLVYMRLESKNLSGVLFLVLLECIELIDDICEVWASLAKLDHALRIIELRDLLLNTRLRSECEDQC
jgi:hypothetical protein